MAKIKKSVTELIGSTPMMEPVNYMNKKGLSGARLLVKLENLNPAGSVKDRVAMTMIEEAEKDGRLKSGGTIIEPTSGNTGIGIASVAAAKGYRAILTLPDTMSVERRTLLKAYGAELVLTDGTKGMKGAIDRAEELHREIPGSMILGQFDNDDNPKAHYDHTGPEIWDDTDGQIDYFVAGVGTGGTLTGAGRFLKEKNPNVKIVAVEPDTSAVLSGKRPGPHRLQGIGAGFIPAVMDMKVCDEVIQAPNDASFKESREFARDEGMIVGISAGAALWAGLEIAARKEAAGKTIVVLLPDSGDRYLSANLFI